MFVVVVDESIITKISAMTELQCSQLFPHFLSVLKSVLENSYTRALKLHAFLGY